MVLGRDVANQELENTLTRILRLRSGSADTLLNREGSELEFKETFNLGSRVKYAKSMAAFANNKGGFLVFGVEPTPHRLKGVNRSNFDSCDPAELTRFLNTTFSPEIQWEMGITAIDGVDLGYIYTYESQDKPVVATQGQADQIREGGIYFRYRGQCGSIRYSELRKILDERVARERNAWMQHLEIIGRSGPTNVGVIDTVHGRLYGGGTPFLIDETLLRKLKFIRKGTFAESSGEPTLTLMGDVKTVSGTVREVPVATGIHGDDLITAFLAQRVLSESDAGNYLREITYQNTPLLPLHYFARLARLNAEEASALIKGSSSTLVGQKNRVINRLDRRGRVTPIGALEAISSDAEVTSPEAIAPHLTSLTSSGQKRNFLLSLLRRKPELIFGAVNDLPIPLFCEALTHLKARELKAKASVILEGLLRIFQDRFRSFRGGERTIFRKAVCFCDEVLNSGEQ